MKYYYSDGNKQFGPLTIEDLMKKNLPPETLVWTEGLDNWVALQTISDCQPPLNITPPPIPPLKSNSGVSGRPKQKFISPKWLLVWCVFNLCALLLSYSGIGFFNGSGERDPHHQSEKFWPFTVLKLEDEDPGIIT